MIIIITINVFRKIEDVEATELHQMLKLLLAESINNCDKKQTAQIREVQRCLSIFDIKWQANNNKII
jgi:hypothetical protein